MALLTETLISLLIEASTFPNILNIAKSLKHQVYFSNCSLKFIFTNLIPMIFDKLEMNGHIERRKDGKMDTKNDLVDFLFKKLNTFGDTDPQDTKYLYYPHVEGVTLKGSLLPSNIT